MAESIKKNLSVELTNIHKHYMDIINCMPNAVYWIDLDCKLKGFNNNFIKLLGINKLESSDLTPYSLLKKYAFWSESRIDELRLDDMSVIFSGKPQYNIEESVVLLGSNSYQYFLSTRVPLLDKNKQVKGLVVILIDIADSRQELVKNNKKSHLNLGWLDQERATLPKVLMVEDNLIAQKVEKNLMTKIGCQVDVAESGELALLLFEPGKYDIVFMDIGLQDTSGYIVSKKIRAKEDGTDHRVPIIALTSYQSEVIKHDCRDYFMAGAITKPLTFNQAEQIIQHFIYNKDIVVDGLVLA